MLALTTTARCRLASKLSRILHHLQSIESYEVVKLRGIRIPQLITHGLRGAASEAPDLNQEGSSIEKSRRDFPPFKAVRQIAGNYGGSSFQNIQECQTFRHSVRPQQPQWLISAGLLNPLFFFFAPPAKHVSGRQLIMFWHLLPSFRRGSSVVFCSDLLASG